MANKTIVFQASDGSSVAVLATDTGTADGHGREIYRLGVDTSFTVTSLTIGAVQVQDSATSTQANVNTVTSIDETYKALAVQAPVLGKTSDAVDKTGGASSINAKLRGLIQILADIWNSTVHALGIEGKGTAGTQTGGVLTVQGDPAGTAIPVSGNLGAASTTVAPANQNSTSSMVDVTGSQIDALSYDVLSFTIVNTGANSINWQVLAANNSDFSDTVTAKASATVTASSVDSYSASPTAFRYYKVQIADTVGGTHGQAKVRGIAKA